jgi:hypothetical protein
VAPQSPRKLSDVSLGVGAFFFVQSQTLGALIALTTITLFFSVH